MSILTRQSVLGDIDEVVGAPGAGVDAEQDAVHAVINHRLAALAQGVQERLLLRQRRLNHLEAVESRTLQLVLAWVGGEEVDPYKDKDPCKDKDP